MSLSVIGSVRARDMPDPNEYKVSGVRANRGRGPGELNGGEKRPGFAVELRRLCCVPGVFGEAIGNIWIPSPGSIFSWNLER
jgi:hypothetical protein